MAGLLDRVFASNTEDPRYAQNMALFGHMVNGNFGGGLLAAGEAGMRAKQAQQESQLRAMQMQREQMALQEAQQQQAQRQQLQQAAQQSFISPETANSLSMGPMRGGGFPEQVQPGFSPQAYLEQLYKIDPMKALAFQQSIAKDESPISVAPGASLVDRKTMKPVFTAPKEQSLPAAIQEYQFAQTQGYRGTFEQWDRERKKAGANSVNLSVNTEKNILGGVADGVAKGINEARGGAQAALGTISTVNRLNEALDSGQVMAGPGTSFRQYGLQVGNMLGVSGKDANEKLLNTRQAIQSLAQLELDAAQQMKGQGQITEAERSIIRRAASGDIDGMTAPELRLLGGVLDRSARSKIQNYRSQVAPLKTMPNASALTPFLDVEEPPARSAPGAVQPIRRYNPATGRIE
jgi:hypothetical protein